MRKLSRLFVGGSLLLLFVCASAFAGDMSMQLVAPEKGWARTSNGHLFWTSDNGGHWTDISPKAPGHTSDTFFLNESHGWVLLSNENEQSNLISFEVASTSDSGRTWAISHMKVPSQKPAELDGWGWIDFVDPHHGWVVLHANSSSAFSWGLLLSTEDGGQTWKELPQAPIAGRPVFATPQDGWISGNGGPKGMYSTHDGGRTWQGDGPPLDGLSSSLPTNPGYGDMKFADAKHGLFLMYLSPSTDAEEPQGTAMASYETGDGGKTWKLQHLLIDRGALTKTGAALSRLVAACVAPEASGRSTLVVAFNDRKHASRVTLLTVREAETTTDAASRAVAENVLRGQGNDIAEVSFASDVEGWARTSLGGLLLTLDGGKSWKDITPDATSIPR